ncbi:phosphate ABC transporter ATP-binding protein [Anaplasmataceae bacterium AB001_6]|nr:phosphate ABC transporter ATP-binding protein [Anaplasmataceae bacterium AB001_6]
MSEKKTKKKEVIASVENLSLTYGVKNVLMDINMDIYPKTVTAFIGSSGCGKSSLLRCFNRMNDFIENCKVTGGLKIDGYDIYSKDVDVVLLRAKIGMVFQKPNPFMKSIYENVAYAPKLHGIHNKNGKIDTIIRKSLENVGLWYEVSDRLQDSAMTLSGGQQQRLCIARAIAVKPRILLMDEPCSALDPLATTSVENLIIELKKYFTIVIVTHSMRQAKKLADNVAYLHKGRLIEYSSTEEFFCNTKHEETKRYLSGEIM